MPEGSAKTSTYSIDAPDVVHLVEFCPFEWSSQLLAIGTGGTATRVTIGACRFQVKYPAKEIHHSMQLEL